MLALYITLSLVAGAGIGWFVLGRQEVWPDLGAMLGEPDGEQRPASWLIVAVSVFVVRSTGGITGLFGSSHLIGRAATTMNHSDIRGSEPHDSGSSGAASL